MSRTRQLIAAAVVAATCLLPARAQEPPPGFSPLFRGKDLEEWKLPKGDNGHWRVDADGLLDYDARSEAKGEKHLWTKRSYRDFVLLVEWRVKGRPGYTHRVPLLLPDGTTRKDERGRDVLVEVDDIQSGILLRGREKNQVNICKWPSGSGQIGSLKLEERASAAQRAAWTPKKKADLPYGEWNLFEITVKGKLVSVKLNDEPIITDAPLPDYSREGPIGLEHQGSVDLRFNRWKSPPSLVQFRGIYIKELR